LGNADFLPTGGGGDYWLVILSGITKNEIDNLVLSSATTKTSSATMKTPATSSASEAPATTIVQTVPQSPATSSPDQQKSSGGGSNTVGIAVGVVVGVVAIAAIVLGVWLFLRYRRRKAMQDEQDRNASVSQFVKGSNGSNPSMNDSRLDPDVMATRRQSDGSIADNADYSRRLRVCANPSRCGFFYSMLTASKVTNA